MVEKKKPGRAEKQKAPAERPGLKKYLTRSGALRKLARPKRTKRYVDALQEEIERSWTPLERAQDLVYDAWESTKARRVTLAREALKVSPDCADAYSILAQDTAKNPDEERELYEKAVMAGERALGPGFEKKYAGYFWADLDTRPYMRARAGLAIALWKLGRRKEAIGHFQEMLRLNPNDNQAIRYLLSHYLLEEREDKALKRLFSTYPYDGSTDWCYTKALWIFAREGASKKAHAWLKRAFEANGMVPSYLLGEKKIPKILPEEFVVGSEAEAFGYAAQCIRTWQKIPGSLQWLLSASTITKLFEGCSIRSFEK